MIYSNARMHTHKEGYAYVQLLCTLRYSIKVAALGGVVSKVRKAIVVLFAPLCIHPRASDVALDLIFN